VLSGSRNAHLTLDSRVRDIVEHPLLREFGERLLPREDNRRFYATPLRQIGSLMPYHGHVLPEVVVDALNRLIDNAGADKTVFYEFYDDDQKRADAAKADTGLFFYPGKEGAPFAMICAGGGFEYVGSLHEGLPLAAAISNAGLNAFVLRYRIDERRATEDLAAAIAFVLRNANAIGVDTKSYSLWGASAGGRMVGNIAVHGSPSYGGRDLPGPAVVIIAYTGQSTYSDAFPPAFIVVSADDPIANVATVERRVERLRNAGVEVEYHRFRTAGHGFGLGVGTDAEGWMEAAVRFWIAHPA